MVSLSLFFTGKSVLMFAALNHRSHTELVRILLEAGCSPSLGTGQLPIHQSCRLGHIDDVRLMLSHDRSLVNSVDFRGRAPIHLAIMGDFVQLVQLLLKEGASPITPTASELNTPLMLCRDVEMADLLYSAGAACTLESVNSLGQSAIILASMRGTISLVRFLLQKGADPNTTWDGHRCLEFALDADPDVKLETHRGVIIALIAWVLS